MIETTYVCRQCGAEDHDWSDSKAAAPMVLNCWKCHSGLQKPIEEMLAGRIGMFPLQAPVEKGAVSK